MKPEEVVASFPSVSSLDDLFRLAHIHEFKRDISPSTRARQVAGYHMTGHEPNYVTKYLERFKLK